ncbi:hypothetical protein HEP84_45375 [Streptomyces sp. RLB1-33]|nr:hypothetical protein [Streptomyces sp. RLB1-33]QIY75214.1 hypothetical protein HEP84_45375 [Streptomyces sp. RLB1-33]
MPYYLLTVESSHRTGFGLQVKPTVRIKELASRVKDLDVPMPGDKLLLLFPGEGTWQAPLAGFAIEAWSRGGVHFSRSSPSDPEFTLTIGGNREPPDLPVGTEIWLDDSAPTGGHRTKGWRQIIEDITAAPWWQADPDTIDPTVPDR